ncbi:MAG: hypothetical protein ABUL77_05320, partial [Bacteroidota bacterium]
QQPVHAQPVHAPAAHHPPPFLGGAPAYVPSTTGYQAAPGQGLPGNAIPATVGGTGTLSWHPSHPASAAARFTPPAGMMAPTAEVMAEPADLLEEEFDDADFSMASGGGMMGSGMQAPAAPPEWAPSGDRPVIRPPVGANPAMRGRQTGSMARGGGASNELGVEESEFDRPTFIRRGIIPPG